MLTTPFIVPTGYGMRPVSCEGPLSRIPIGHKIKSILDLGCGGGRVAIWLSLYRDITFEEVYGIDFRKDILAEYQKFKEEKNLFPGAKFKLFGHGYQTIRLPNHSIDLITAYMSMHHVSKWTAESTVDEIARVSAANGLICLWRAFKFWRISDVRSLCRRNGLKDAIVQQDKEYCTIINAAMATLVGPLV